LPYHITYSYDILSLCLYVLGFATCSLLNIVLPMFMFLFLLCDIMWSFFGENDSMRVFFIICLHMYCRWIPSYQVGSWDNINWLTPQPFSTGAKPGYWFPTSYVVVTHVCVSELKWEVIVHVADNSGMSYQNSFNFLFIIRHSEGEAFVSAFPYQHPEKLCLRLFELVITTAYLSLYHWLHNSKIYRI
jgi:hypothetical protein